MATTQVSSSVLKDGAVTSAKLDTNIAIDGNLTVDTNTLYVDSANNRVGIGTTSPEKPLHIEDLNTNGIIARFRDASGTSLQRLDISSIATGMQIRSAYSTGVSNQLNIETAGGSSFITLATNSTERMRITSSGDVDIKSGSLTLNQAEVINFKNVARDTTWGQIQGLASATVFSFAGTEQMRIDSSGRVGIGRTPAGDILLDIAKSNVPIFRITDTQAGGKYFLLGVDTNNTFLRTDGNMYFQRSGGTNMVITSSGNVGIGTTSPQQLLSISNTSNNAYLHCVAGTSNLGGVWVGDSDSNYVGGFLYDNSINTSFLYTNGAEAMRIDSSGNVGIGTTSPSARLEVSSTAPSGDRTLPHNVLTLTAESSNLPYNGFGGAINFKNRSYTYGILNSARIRSVIDSDSASNRGAGLAFDVTNSSQVYNTSLFLKYDGNVGIGVTDPQHRLHMNGGATRTDLQITLNSFGNGVSDGAQFGIQTGGTYIWNFENNDLYFGTNNSRKMTIKPSGNVGIGTTNPTYKLHVYGNADEAISTRVHNGYAGTNATAEIWAVANGNNFRIVNYPDADTGNANRTDFISTASSSYFTFSPSSTEKMRLQSDGDLHVDGDVIAYSTTISDQRLKDDIKTIDNALETIEKLRGVSYVWNNGKRKNQKDIGLIAQEVEKVIPEIVHDKKMPLIDDEVYKTIDYEKLIGVLIESVKELSAEVKELRSQINI
jgi:hypothetical protein